MICYDGCCRGKRHYSMAMAFLVQVVFFSDLNSAPWSDDPYRLQQGAGDEEQGTLFRSGSCSKGLSQNVQNPSESHGLIMFNMFNIILPYFTIICPRTLSCLDFFWVKLYLKRKWPDID